MSGLVAPKKMRGFRASEADCQSTIVAAARILGYRVLAIRPGMGKAGNWSTPIQGDPGYPDLTLAHPRAGVLHLELKRWPNKLETEQNRWGEMLISAGAVWMLWWVPEELDDLLAFLAERTMRKVGR